LSTPVRSSGKWRASPGRIRAGFSTKFPHTVFIDIRERAVATFAGSDESTVVDRDVAIDVVDGVPIDYMLVTDANPDVDRRQFAGRPFASAAQLAIALPQVRALTKSVGVVRRLCTLRCSLATKRSCTSA
jgi:hypothetical protein